jgi:hypothetical protein
MRSTDVTDKIVLFNGRIETSYAITSASKSKNYFFCIEKNRQKQNVATVGIITTFKPTKLFQSYKPKWNYNKTNTDGIK